MKRPPTKAERKKEKEKKVIMIAPQEAIVILRTNGLFFCVGVCVKRNSAIVHKSQLLIIGLYLFVN